MSTTNNDDWFNNLAEAANLLFKADQTKRDNLSEIFEGNQIWKRLATENLNKEGLVYKNATALVDELKTYKQEPIKDLDFNDIKAKLSLLNGLLIEVASDQSGDKKLTYSVKDKISRNNVAFAVVLIAYIQYTNKVQNTNKVQTNEEFAKKFIKLTKCLDETKVEPTSQQNSSTSRAAQAQQDMTLILVFGQSHKMMINAIKDKNYVALDESDYALLENKCEWFWYGNEKYKPDEIAKNEQDNMCWLQLNINLSNAPTVTNILHIKDLIKTIKKQPEILSEIKSRDTAFNLDNKVFTKV